jgi:hypothetical protein
VQYQVSGERWHDYIVARTAAATLSDSSSSDSPTFVSPIPRRGAQSGSRDPGDFGFVLFVSLFHGHSSGFDSGQPATHRSRSVESGRGRTEWGGTTLILAVFAYVLDPRLAKR